MRAGPHAGHARRELDEYVCSRCRKRWSVDDPDPPLCEPRRLDTAAGEVPEALPDWLAEEMAIAYEVAIADGVRPDKAMGKAFQRLRQAL